MKQESAELEEHLIHLLALSCQFDLQSGYTEIAVAKVQAALEFSVLTPSGTVAVPGPGKTFPFKQSELFPIILSPSCW